MKRLTKRAAALLSAVMMFLLCPMFAALAESESDEVLEPVYAASLNNGTYDVTVQSSASMFKIVACELTVSDSDLSAVMTLSGKGYEKLYMGTGEQALEADESEYIFFREDADGKYTYRVPVEALDKPIDCAAFSFKKQQWYDRTLVFESASLPENAFAQAEPAWNYVGPRFAALKVVLICGAICVAAVVIVGVTVLVNKTRKARS